MAQQHPNTLIALTRAILQAQQELRVLEDFEPVWQLLIDFDVIQFECSPSIHVEKYYTIQDIIRTSLKVALYLKVQILNGYFSKCKNGTICL